MARTVVVGDVHGCSAELEDLLESLCFTEGRDRLVSVGDLVAKGPDSQGALGMARRLGARVVRGNHEDKLLGARARGDALGPDHASLARALSEEQWAMLGAMPLWIDLPEHGLRVVHAGVPPDVAPEQAPPDALLRMRTIDANGRWSSEPDAGSLWGSLYEGPPHIVFGHHARSDPQFHPWATGIDTGCVYGGRLTAVVLADGEQMPRGNAARAVLRDVKARRKYSAQG